MKIYTEVNITPASSGFGMYERGELQIGTETSYADFSDLVQAIAENSDDAMPLEDALNDPDFIEAGVENISGSIYNEPATIYAILNDGELRYIGIEESEVEDDFYGEESEAEDDFEEDAKNAAEMFDDSADPLVFDEIKANENGKREAFFHDSENIYYFDEDIQFHYASAR